MITTLLACVITLHPLAISGDESGFWFVGDRPLHVTSSQHELRTRVSPEKYAALQTLEHRPAAIAVDGQTLWFVDVGEGIALYRTSLPDMKNRLTPRANTHRALSFRGFLETDLLPTDLIVLDGKPIIACGGSTLSLFEFSSGAWVALPSLEVADAHVAQLQGQLIAVAPYEHGIAMWKLEAQQWVGGERLEVEGTLVNLITRADWPIIVLERKGVVHVVGVQHGDPIEITSMKEPKGRWGLVPTSKGMSVVGVERIGVTTVIDIGWPSGELSESIVLEQQFESENSFLTAIMIALPIAFVFILLRVRNRTPQKSAK